MTLSNDTSTTEQRIADLRAILSLPADQIRKTKGSALGRWEHVVASLLGDPSGAVEQEFEDSRGRLPSRVLASAAVQAWGVMPLNRRKNYLHWIEGLESEKAAIHRITLAAGLLHKDPETSQAQIIAVSLNSKENVARLADELLNRHSEALPGLLPDDAPLYKVLKVAQCLVQLASHERTDPQARYQALRTVLMALNRHLGEGKSMFTSVFEAAGKVLDGLPANLHRQIAGDLQESAPELYARFYPNIQVAVTAPANTQLPLKSDATPATAVAYSGAPVNATSVANSPEHHQTDLKVSGRQPSPVEHETSGTSRNSALELFRIFEEASQYISRVEEERQRLCADLSSRIQQAESLEETLAAVSAERDSALERLAGADSTRAALNSRIGELSTNLEKTRERSEKGWAMLRETESRVTILNTHVAELAEEIQRLTEEAAKEREALVRQVQGTAETRLDEIKNDIGFAVRRVVRDVPDKSKRVNPDSAQRMLIRLHEVLSELERRGIRVKGE